MLRVQTTQLKLGEKTGIDISHKKRYMNGHKANENILNIISLQRKDN